MFMAVEAIQFFLLGNPQADGFIDDFKNDNGHNHSENADGGNTEGFDADELDSAHAVFFKNRGFCEYTGENRSKHTAAPVNAGGADRVVNFENPVNKFNNEDNRKAADDADGESAVVGYNITAGGNANQTGEGAVHGHGDIGFSIADPGEEEGD